MKLIINADDFGISKGANYGIIDAYKNGVVRSASIMAGMPAFDHAVGLLKSCKGLEELGCGVHLTLSAYKPVLNTHKTIVDENGFFYKRISEETAENKFDLEEVYNEFSAQIQKVINSGIEITHLDSHHHVHTLKVLKPVVEQLLSKYNLPIRGGLLYELDYDKIVPFSGFFYDETVSIDGFKKVEINKYEVLETMTHPAYLDSFIMENSSYNLKRVEELKVLTSEEVKEFVDENGITLCNYRDIYK
ncbi:chitin disaccharide deacetylase [Clostridium sp. AL.422]|uniref:chitin disaccharide deacetylase n=1 Tax=Clostridium TaxID=1485 RepID=UPI00293DC683|nr:MULTISPECIES: chitin disaccharide deacetylase [unclassified Clostridium]MDV4149573.1 chitin disaccharide deacetylase [Clostridium sp. AL.422]